MRAESSPPAVLAPGGTSAGPRAAPGAADAAAAAADDPVAPFFIVFNAGAGRGDAQETLDTVRRVLDEAGRRHEILAVDDPRTLAAVARQAVERARACGGVVVACGGDGTLSTVAQATLGSGCRYGVIPRGTFNYFGRAHGIPSDVEAATRILLTARAQPVQVGLVNDRLFLVNASLGLYPQSLEHREAQSRRLGRSRWVAVWAGLVTLWRRWRPLHLMLEQDTGSRRVRTLTLFVGNNRLQLEQIGLSEAGAVEEGRLVAVVVRPRSSLTLLWLMVRGAFGSLTDDDGLEHFALADLRVVTARRHRHRRSLKIATDGEVTRMKVPIHFRPAPEPLRLLKPEPAPDAAPD